MATSPTDIFQTMLSGIQSGKRIAQGNVQNQQRQQQLDLEKQQEQRANQQADSEFHQHMIELGAQPIVNGMVKEDQPLPDLSALGPAGGSDASAGAPKTVSIVRKADPGNTVKWKDATGDQVAYELPSVGSQVWRQNMAARAKAQGQVAQETTQGTAQGTANAQIANAAPLAAAQTQAQIQARQKALEANGVPLRDEIADTIGIQRGTKVLQSELPDLQDKAEKILKDRLLLLNPGQKAVQLPGTTGANGPGTSGAPVVATGGPPQPSDDFGKYFLPARAQQLGKTVPDPNGPRKPTDMDPGDVTKAFQDFATSKKDPELLKMAVNLGQLHMDMLRQQMGNQPFDVKPGTAEDRIASQLAYGQLTFPDFNKLYSSRFNQAKKQGIYDAAMQKNPNFTPAGFEMGFKFASDKKTQGQLAALDNVITGVPGLLEASDAASRTGVKKLNQYMKDVGIQFGGKSYANVKAARTAFADELSGALGFGGATDMSKQMGLDMTDTDLSPEAFKSVINDTVVPFVNRKRKAMLDQMGPYGLPGMNPAATKAAQQSGSGLPKGNGKVIDPATAKQYLDAADGDKKKALKNAQDNGWK